MSDRFPLHADAPLMRHPAEPSAMEPVPDRAPISARARPPATAHRLSQISVTAPQGIQAELTIGATDDPLEREADDVAAAVMRMPEPATDRAPAIQRACWSCETDEQVQNLQRLAAPEDEDEELQASPLTTDLQPSAAGGLQASPAAVDKVAAARQGGLPLSSAERDFFQPRLAHDLSAVRIHAGPAAAEAAASVGARAFTIGPDIVVGAQQPGLSTPAGRQLLAHELTHVVQQGHAPALEPEEAE